MIKVDFPQTKTISLKSYIDEINRSIECKNYLSALSIALMIPDVCCNIENQIHGKEEYIQWFDKYVSVDFEIPNDELRNKYGDNIPEIEMIRFDGKKCYELRCAMIHEGTPPAQISQKKKKINNIELSINSQSERNEQYGEAKTIMRYGGKKQYTLRINIVHICEYIIKGAYAFLEARGVEDIEMFTMIDWDNIGNFAFVTNQDYKK